MRNLAARRLLSQRLIGPPCESPAEVVRWLGAVQSQDYGGATWALAQRTERATESDINGLVDDGIILRTHVLRPTWHFVLADDIRWLLELTGPRVRAGLTGRYRQLEIDYDVIAWANAAFGAALSGGRSLTRPELGEVLRARGIVTEGQRLPHLLMAAELDGLITSGPRRGRQHTYALLAERAPNARSHDREEALAELVWRYFRSHGPAQLQDFVWWSGLTVTDARTGIELAGRALTHEVIEGEGYWCDAQTGPTPDATAAAHLLPNFDEYTVGYRDRTAVVDSAHPFDPALFSFGSVLSNILTVGGRVRGSWRRVASSAGMRIDARLLAPLTPGELDAMGRVAEQMSHFHGRPVKVEGLQP